jgi:hypothetical protein
MFTGVGDAPYVLDVNQPTLGKKIAQLGFSLILRRPAGLSRRPRAQGSLTSARMAIAASTQGAHSQNLLGRMPCPVILDRVGHWGVRGPMVEDHGNRVGPPVSDAKTPTLQAIGGNWNSPRQTVGVWQPLVDAAVRRSRRWFQGKAAARTAFL